MKQIDLEREIKSGPSWWMGILGLVIILTLGLAHLGGSEFRETWGLWLLGIALIWLSRVGDLRLNERTVSVRNGFWRKEYYNLDHLKWVDFNPGKKMTLWFDSGAAKVQVPFWRYKKAVAAIRQIGEENLTYFDYQLVERSKLKRGQVAGCLDCHETFLPTDLKTWEKLPKSILWGRKDDQYFTVCPNCKSHWFYMGPNPQNPVTKTALREMDINFQMNEKTKLREIIGESLMYQTFSQHRQ